MRSVLFKIYWKLECWLVPGLRFSQDVFAEVLESQVIGRQVWLDLGCGRRMFPEWMVEQQNRVLSRTQWVVGLDPDFASLRDHVAYTDKVQGSGYQIPFASATFDLVNANMVLEHMREPASLLAEIQRVLRPGGRLVFHTPNRDSWFIRIAARTPEWLKHALIPILEGRRLEDVFPTHYCFNRRADIENLAKAAGFRVVSLKFISSSAVTATLGPLAIPELLWLRFLSRPRYEPRRTNIIGVLEISPNSQDLR